MTSLDNLFTNNNIETPTLWDDFENASPEDDSFDPDHCMWFENDDLPLADSTLDLDSLTIVDRDYFADDFADENSSMVSIYDHSDGSIHPLYNGFLSGKLLENGMIQSGQYHEADIEHVILCGGVK